MWQSFVCAMVAAVTLQAFDPFRTGKLVQYQVTYSRGWHDFETVPFALLGVIGVSSLWNPEHHRTKLTTLGALRWSFHSAEHESRFMEEVRSTYQKPFVGSIPGSLGYRPDQLSQCIDAVRT